MELTPYALLPLFQVTRGISNVTALVFVVLQSLGFSFPLGTVARTDSDTSHLVYGSFTTLMVFGEE